MFTKKQSYFILFILCFVMAVSTASVFAAGGDGTGGGNGENRDIPLTLKGTSVSDGATGVAVNETMQLDFNKNICNITVLADNKKCFHLTDEKGNALPIRLVFPDNQVQKDYRREVFITPLKDLSKNTQYRIAVDSTLMAKNGTAIDNAYTITFTTGTKQTDQENKILKKLGDNIITYETSYSETGDSVPVNKSGLDDVSQDQGTDTGSVAKIAAIVLIILVLVFTAVIFILKRRKE